VKEGVVVKEFGKEILKFIREQKLIVSGDRVLIACSGGVDSVVLLHFLAEQREKLAIEVAAVHVDHMLRGEESAADGKLVEDLCKILGIPFFGRAIAIPDIIKKQGGNVQAVCREERYAFFSSIMAAHDYDILATAHHAGDQLETVLMQVTKGGTPSGIPIKRRIEGGVLIRPMLPVIKKSLYTYAMENKLQFREDPSNKSEAYMRNRFRQHLTPLVLSENPNAAQKVVSMTSNLQEDELFLGSLAKERLEEIVEFTEEGLPFVNRITFTCMPTALQRRMIPLLLGYLYDEENIPIYYKSGVVDQILHHLQGQEGNVSIDLPLGYQFLREYDKLTFMRSRVHSITDVEKTIEKGLSMRWMKDSLLYWTKVDEVEKELIAQAKDVMYFDLPDASFPLIVRQRKDGDRIMLPGMNHSKRLSRLFIDEKISKTDRDRLPVIVTALDEVCAVPGLRYGTAFTKNRTDASKYIFIVSTN